MKIDLSKDKFEGESSYSRTWVERTYDGFVRSVRLTEDEAKEYEETKLLPKSVNDRLENDDMKQLTRIRFHKDVDDNLRR